MGITPLWDKKPLGNVLDFKQYVSKPANKARVLLKNPVLADLANAVRFMHTQGVPLDATIGFQQWNNPKDNYYVIATWPVDGDRQP